MKDKLLALADNSAPVLVTIPRYCTLGRVGDTLFITPSSRALDDPVFFGNVATFRASDVMEIKEQFSISGRIVTRIDLK